METGGGYAAARGSVGEDFFFLQCVSGRKKEVGGCAGGRRGGGVGVVECFKNRLLTRMVGHWLGGERRGTTGTCGVAWCRKVLWCLSGKLYRDGNALPLIRPNPNPFFTKCFLISC